MSATPSLTNGTTTRRYHVWRFLAWGLIVGGFWLFWAFRCYKSHDGMHLEHLLRNIAWGGIPTLFLAIALPIATRRFYAVGSPEEPGWKRWVRLLICLIWAGVVAFAIFDLYIFGIFVKFMIEPWYVP